jgi:hypothetical protein
MLAFCKPVSSKKRFLPYRKLNDDFTFTLFDRADAVLANDWGSVAGDKSVFLELPYLKIVEKCLYTKLMCRYVIVYNQTKPCGIIYYQVADFKAGTLGDLLTGQSEITRSKRLNLFEKYIDSNKHEVLMRLFTCGNNLVSGQYGFLFTEGVSEQQSLEIVMAVTDSVSKEEKLRGTISAILLKDFDAPPQPEALILDEKYIRFFVEPNMVVAIPPGIQSINDYVGLFSKKYRNRAKSIFKNFTGITVKDLDLEAIRQQEKDIYKLYENIFDNARFKLSKLPLNYFGDLKALFGAKFHVKGCYLGDRMVAFGSCFTMPDGSLEAHYIGLDYELNNQYDLYQNMLYIMIGEAIRNGCSKANLGRTAAEIKTTVGAKAVDLLCYIKPQNAISRFIQKPFISFLQPGEWTPRNPFKEEVPEKAGEAQN